ncbi:hypothetical protein SFIMM107S_05981 [Streptomyces griseus]
MGKTFTTCRTDAVAPPSASALPERSPLLMRERRSSPPDSSAPDSSPATGSAGKPQEDNPFAAPPADRPDQPWQPRRPSASNGSDGSDGRVFDGNGDGSSALPPGLGQPVEQQAAAAGATAASAAAPAATAPAATAGPERGGPWRHAAGTPPTPLQRRARYAVLGGICARFFALFDFTEIALLLGALSTYWAISAAPHPAEEHVRDGPHGNWPRTLPGQGTGPAPVYRFAARVRGPGYVRHGGRPTRDHACRALARLALTAQGISGGADHGGRRRPGRSALLALLIVATTYTVQLVCRELLPACVRSDALTKTAALAGNDELPKPLEPLFGSHRSSLPGPSGFRRRAAGAALGGGIGGEVGHQAAGAPRFPGRPTGPRLRSFPCQGSVGRKSHGLHPASARRPAPAARLEAGFGCRAGGLEQRPSGIRRGRSRVSAVRPGLRVTGLALLLVRRATPPTPRRPTSGADATANSSWSAASRAPSISATPPSASTPVSASTSRARPSPGCAAATAAAAGPPVRTTTAVHASAAAPVSHHTGPNALERPGTQRPSRPPP